MTEQLKTLDGQTLEGKLIRALPSGEGPMLYVEGDDQPESVNVYSGGRIEFRGVPVCRGCHTADCLSEYCSDCNAKSKQQQAPTSKAKLLDNPTPPTCLHALGQGLVNQLWQEGQELKAEKTSAKQSSGKARTIRNKAVAKRAAYAKAVNGLVHGLLVDIDLHDWVAAEEDLDAIKELLVESGNCYPTPTGLSAAAAVADALKNSDS